MKTTQIFPGETLPLGTRIGEERPDGLLLTEDVIDFATVLVVPYPDHPDLVLLSYRGGLRFVRILS
jgi:hypothetical protein